MATDHRGNPINENNLAKTNEERFIAMGDSTTGMTDAQMMDAEMQYLKDLDMSPEEEEIAERRSQSYMREMEEYYRPVSDRTYGKDEMIENDIDDDKGEPNY